MSFAKYIAVPIEKYNELKNVKKQVPTEPSLSVAAVKDTPSLVTSGESIVTELPVKVSSKNTEKRLPPGRREPKTPKRKWIV